ncbi:Meiosis specific protein Spo22/ZIP4/TEX11 [Gracilaria domingensis]|nr:Meiosis specific protein Spo22/ZIP4/TEX11 [Gracilaria domingensis]
METVGDERIRAAKSLRKIEEVALMLEELSKSSGEKSLSSGFPNRMSSILNSISSISSRDEAERLLAAGTCKSDLKFTSVFLNLGPDLRFSDKLIPYECTGVSIWNSVISAEAQPLEKETIEILVRVRHLAVDCMYMSTTALDGISARYNIDNLSLLKFYTACGQKYVAELNDVDNAELCYSKASEFATIVLKETVTTNSDQIALSRVLFDLLLGRAECSWEREEFQAAEDYVQEARKYLDDLPGEFEFLATVEYNFGLFTYQEKETMRALKWLQRSMQTRGDPSNKSMNEQKQAKTMRLAGVCLLALQRYEESWEMMRKAEETHHDPVGSYLLLKLSIITKKENAVDDMMSVIEDNESDVDVCVAAVSLFGDAQRVSEAVLGYEALFKRFEGDFFVQACTIGPRYFEALCATGKTQKALSILETCSGFISRLSEKHFQEGNDNLQDNTDDGKGSKISQLLRWSTLLLSVGSAQADRKDFRSSVLLLTRALDLARTAKDISAHQASSSTEPLNALQNIVLENEARVCRLASSCALCSITNVTPKVDMRVSDGNSESSEQKTLKEGRNLMLSLSLQHASRAKELEQDDYSPRLLLFRTHLLSGNHAKAAQELEESCTEIRSFDPGALAEAACAARDIGSTASVVAVLRCILALDTDLWMKSIDSTTGSPPNGFYGTVLLACVKLQQRTPENCNAEHSEAHASELAERVGNTSENVLSTLRLGLNGVSKLGLDVAFNKSEDFEEKISYLVNVSWNEGREAGMNLHYEMWEAFFTVCYELSMFQRESEDVLQTKRMARLMSACANVENPDSKMEDFERARTQLQQARKISQRLGALSHLEGEDPIEGVLLFLEARCCVGSQDMEGLRQIVQMALEKDVTAGVLEQLAAVCFNFRIPRDGNSDLSAKCIDLTTSLLAKAGDRRLCDEKKDLESLSLTLREHLGVELSRGCDRARSYQVYRKIAGVVVEYGDKYPISERRWLVATGWDRTQMFKQLGQNEEATRWCELVLTIIKDSIPLSTYRPRLEAFLTSLS